MSAFVRASKTVSLAAWLAAGLALCAGLWTGRAYASPSYPEVLERTLSLSCTPSCALCHVGTPGFATTNTPFGIQMRRQADLRCCKDKQLEGALQLFTEMGIDSDDDGVSDIDELMAGTDPNGEGKLACEEPYVGDSSRIFGEGCSLAAPRRARKPAHDEGDDGVTASLLTVALVGLVVRLRTRRARQAS